MMYITLGLPNVCKSWKRMLAKRDVDRYMQPVQAVNPIKFNEIWKSNSFKYVYQNVAVGKKTIIEENMK